MRPWAVALPIALVLTAISSTTVPVLAELSAPVVCPNGYRSSGVVAHVSHPGPGRTRTSSAFYCIDASGTPLETNVFVVLLVLVVLAFPRVVPRLDGRTRSAGVERLMKRAPLALLLVLACNDGTYASPDVIPVGDAGHWGLGLGAYTASKPSPKTPPRIAPLDVPQDLQFAVWPPPDWVAGIAARWRAGAMFAEMYAGHIDTSGIITLTPTQDGVSYTYETDICYSGAASEQMTGMLQIHIDADKERVRATTRVLPCSGGRGATPVDWSVCPLRAAFAAVTKAGRLPPEPGYAILTSMRKWHVSNDQGASASVDLDSCSVVR